MLTFIIFFSSISNKYAIDVILTNMGLNKELISMKLKVQGLDLELKMHCLYKIIYLIWISGKVFSQNLEKKLNR